MQENLVRFPLVILRQIQESDNKDLARIIRASLKSYGLDRPGTVFTDPTTDDLYNLFKTPGSVYFVAEENGLVLGGCGIFPTKGLPVGCVELVKLYLSPEYQGKGLGRKLMETSLEWAKENHHTQVYLETFAELASAVILYEKLGFKSVPEPMGESGHHACEIWMLKVF